MHTKRGLSDVVTTVLIILLVLAAVVIIWTFVGPAIRTGSEKVAGASSCLEMDLEVTKCDVVNAVPSSPSPPGADTFAATVKRGIADVVYDEIYVVYEDLSGTTHVYKTGDTGPSELGTKPYTSPNRGSIGLTGEVSATVTARVKSSSGSIELCPIIARKVRCN